MILGIYSLFISFIKVKFQFGSNLGNISIRWRLKLRSIDGLKQVTLRLQDRRFAAEQMRTFLQAISFPLLKIRSSDWEV